MPTRLDIYQVIFVLLDGPEGTRLMHFQQAMCVLIRVCSVPKLDRDVRLLMIRDGLHKAYKADLIFDNPEEHSWNY
ncbi:MAG: hypothetical protein ACU84Q_13090 [Gammaproteobacteria bacterium]